VELKVKTWFKIGWKNGRPKVRIEKKMASRRELYKRGLKRGKKFWFT